MRLTGLPLPLLLAALAALAGVLLVLHRLRTRPREVAVPTLLFWKGAQEAPRRRRLGGPLRHPRTYLFLLLLGSLLLLAVAGPVPAGEEDRYARVVVLEAGAGIAGDFERARASAREELEEPSLDAPVALVRAGVRPRLLAGFGAPRPQVLEALDRVRPDEGPADVAAALEAAAAVAGGRSGADVVWIASGRAPAPEPAPVPHRVRVVGRDGPDRALEAAAFEDGVLRVLLTGPVRTPLSLAAARPEGGAPVTVPVAADRAVERWVAVPGLDPDGSVVHLRLRGADAVAADDGLAVRLPRRRGVGRVLLRGTSRPLALLVEADGLLTAAAGPGEADLVVHVVEGRGDPLPGGPVEGGGEPCGVPVGVRALPPGPGRTELLASGRALCRALPGEPPRLEIAADLLDPGLGFVRHAAGARVIGRLLRRHAGVRDGSPVVPAGALHEVATTPGGERRWLRGDAPGLARVPGGDVAVALRRSPWRKPGGGRRPPAGGSGGPGAWELLAAAALLLLCVDAALHLAGRIP